MIYHPLMGSVLTGPVNKSMGKINFEPMNFISKFSLKTFICNYLITEIKQMKLIEKLNSLKQQLLAYLSTAAQSLL